MANIYKLETIARTAGSGSGLTSFDTTPSINDSGLVSFVGNLNGEEDLFTGDGSNPITNLSSSFSNGRFSSGIEINNDNQIVAVNSNNAIRLWDADNPGSPKKTVGTAIFGNEFSDFDNIFPFASINNTTPPQSEESEVVFNADPKGDGSTSVGLHTYKSFSGDNTYFEGPLANSIGIPMLADNGRVVSKDNNSTIKVFNYGLNQSQIIANDASVGRAPGISDNGKAVAFYGDNAGEGIFISVETDSGWERHRIAGVAGNGKLDPGETYEDSNSNGEFDSGEEDLGLISSFSQFERIGINYSETEDGGLGTVTYLAKDESGNESLISSQFNISSSSPEASVSHSLVAKVGDPANEVDTGLTGNIQDLNIYDPINDPGQIAFWAKTTTGEEAIVRANPIRKPILIVPGIGGSLPENADFKEWLFDRGFEPDRLQPEPFSDMYGDLVETLKQAGYQEGVDLFVATHDWRLNPAPIDGTINGEIERSFEQLTDNTYEYSVDQLAFWMNKAEEEWKNQFSVGESIPELDSVDVIAHSAGGSVVRSYIQSTAYDQTDFSLPKVDNFITLGVPFRGASVTWNLLQNDFGANPILGFLGRIINFAYQKVIKEGENNEIITLSGNANVEEAITRQEALELGATGFIEEYIPNLRALLATYPFIKDLSGNSQTPEDSQQNKLLLDLNNGFDIDSERNPNLFAEEVEKLTVIFGTGTSAKDAVEIRDEPEFNVFTDQMGRTIEVYAPNVTRFEDGYSKTTTPGEEWYKDLVGDIDPRGDGTVPEISGVEQFRDFPKPNVILEEASGVGHTALPYNVDVQNQILKTLNIPLKEELISTDQHIPRASIVSLGEIGDDVGGIIQTARDLDKSSSILLDPVEGFVIDGQGRRLGYTSTTGAVTEIPNSFWLGEADGIGFIYDTAEGPFSLELTGLGEDYFVSVSLETEDGQAFLESEGFLAAGEQLTLDVPLLPPSLFTEIRTNAGGEAYTDTSGQQWIENLGFSNGNTFATQNAIEQTEDDVLYQSEYFGADFDYGLAVENGSYDVTLKFAEVFFNQAGKRVFDVSLEGQTVLDDFDIYSEAGGKNIAVDRTFTVDVNDNSLNLDFLASLDKAKVSAIEVKPILPSFYVNAGGDAYTDTSGQLWMQSEGFNNAGTFTRANAIAQTEDDVLYQSEAFGNNFSYQQEVENGSYDVTLKFAEVFFNNAGQRVFDVSLEGQTVLDDFDIVESAGGKNIATDRTFNVNVTDGSIDLGFLSSEDKAKVSAIEIKPTLPQFRTNAGGEAYTDLGGQSWLESSGFVGAGTFTRANPIAQTEDDVLYQSEVNGNNFSYQQEVENGSYDVTLKFAEVFFNNPGQRVFDVNLEGQTVLDNFDIVESAGGKNIAVDRTFNVNVTDGSIDLGFLSSVNKAKVSAIEIKPTLPQFRTNAGGGAYTDLGGQSWLESSGFVGAGTFTRANPIAQTEDDVLYQSEVNGNNFSYQQEVENGSYDVTLKFAEIFFNQPGQRVFDVSLEGQTVLDDFDIVESSGGKNIATDRTFNVNVTDGSIDLGFLSSVNKAKVSAIEIKPNVPSFRTNAGGEAYTDISGQSWLMSDGFVGAGTFTRANAIAQTEDDVLYQSEAVGNNFSYQQEVENGSYDVTLKFAEVFFNNAGQRVFDVEAEGQTVLDDFDIVESAGGKNIAVDRTFTVGVSDGTLDLDFIASVDNAKVSAIEIKPSFI